MYDVVRVSRALRIPYQMTAVLLLLVLSVACRHADSPPASTSLPLRAPPTQTTTPAASPTTLLATATPETESSPATKPVVPTPSVPPPKLADAEVIYVRAVRTAENTWTFEVTVQHPDTGWEDYADGWDVLLPDNTVIKPNPNDPFTRLLLHPHVDEQPFTRSQSGIVIPQDVTQVTVRAHDLVDGYGGRQVVIDLTAESGPDFDVAR